MDVSIRAIRVMQRLAVGVTLLAAGESVAATIVYYDYPNGSFDANASTIIYKINNNNVFVGTDIPQSGGAAGSTRAFYSTNVGGVNNPSLSGEISSFAANFGAVAARVAAYGINDAGVVVGNINRGDNNTDVGSFKTTYLPGGTEYLPGGFGGSFVPNGIGNHSYILDINNHGDFVGFTSRNTLATQGFLVTGFVPTGSPGVPGGPGTTPGTTSLFGNTANGSHTEAHGINDADQIVGYFAGNNGNDPHTAFLKNSPSDPLTAFQIGGRSTDFWDINNLGEIVGSFLGADGLTHGLYLSQFGGTPVQFDIPGATGTAILGLNDRGIAVGIYGLPGSNKTHGFLLTDFRATSDPIDTPEPASLALLGGGLAGLWITRRRRA